MDRRRFLIALGAGTVSAGVLPSGIARAEAGAPKRLIVLSSGHGSVHAKWAMNPTGAPSSQTWAADLTGLTESEFSPILQPLHRHRNRLVAIEGLSNISAELDLPGYRHEKGWIHAWTGGWVHFPGTALFSTEPSLDQRVAAQLSRADRLPSLELSVNYGRPICHAGKAQQLPLEEDPRRVWSRLFGLASSPDPLLSGQPSVLDFAKAEFSALGKRLGSEDRVRLETHRELVSQLEARVRGMAQATCSTAPELDSLLTTEDYDAAFRAHGELIAAAFSCDLTRVVSLSLGDVPSDAFGWGWYLSGDAHNDFAHRLYIDEQAQQAMADYNRFHAAQIAWLVDLLSTLPDSDGQSIMDNTLIVWGNELADGWHGYQYYPSLMIGGSWAHQTGQYLHYPIDSTPVPILTPSGMSERAGLPHQHLLVSAANAMGLGVDHIGLTELTTRAGERVSLTGGLPGL